MRTDLPQSVLDAADIVAVTQLVLVERESRDLGRWDQMRDCFHADSLVHVSWFTGTGHEFVNGSIDMARRNVLAKHRLGPILVRLAGDRAVASLSAIIDIPATLSGVEVQLSSHARFLYRVERRAERWRIFSFDAIYMRDEFTTAIPGLALADDAGGSGRLPSVISNAVVSAQESGLRSQFQPSRRRQASNHRCA